MVTEIRTSRGSAFGPGVGRNSEVRALLDDVQLVFVAGRKPLRTAKLKYDRRRPFGDPADRGRLPRGGRGAAALETLKSWNTGHPGGLSTIHANSGADVPRRLEDLITEVAAAAPGQMIGQAIERMVQIGRTPDGRRAEGYSPCPTHDDYRVERPCQARMSLLDIVSCISIAR